MNSDREHYSNLCIGCKNPFVVDGESDNCCCADVADAPTHTYINGYCVACCPNKAQHVEAAGRKWYGMNVGERRKALSAADLWDGNTYALAAWEQLPAHIRLAISAVTEK